MCAGVYAHIMMLQAPTHLNCVSSHAASMGPDTLILCRKERIEKSILRAPQHCAPAAPAGAEGAGRQVSNPVLDLAHATVQAPLPRRPQDPLQHSRANLHRRLRPICVIESAGAGDWMGSEEGPAGCGYSSPGGPIRGYLELVGWQTSANHLHAPYNVCPKQTSALLRFYHSRAPEETLWPGLFLL
jgi:hypothetical protein